MMSLLSLILTAFKQNDLGSNTPKLREHEQIPADLIFFQGRKVKQKPWSDFEWSFG